ncbi:sigma-70 family RNA polymerase sigma factor [candidate division GN15 bacterium]|nr:sigma-70 family RNA polymerase sigma factor [candidate division GN15 bacterium]
MNDADRQDWAAYSRGERNALQRIFERHKDAMFTYCVYMTGNREDAEDLVQEAFARLIGRRNGEPIASIRDWLFICTRNLTLNHLKRKAPASLAGSIPVTDSDPEIRRFIDTILDRLTPEERELVLLREQHGFSSSEIAAMLELSPENVRIRLYRVRKKMQSIARE